MYIVCKSGLFSTAGSSDSEYGMGNHSGSDFIQTQLNVKHLQTEAETEPFDGEA